jgi:hypothetical protein
MSQWAPQKADTLAAVAAEITQHYGTGKVGVFGQGAQAFSAELAEVLGASGPTVSPSDAELSTAAASKYNFTIWLDHGITADRDARTIASAIIDVSDPEHPRRVFADAC